MVKSFPIRTIHLFEELDDLLILKLSALKSSDWDKPTLAGNWTIKDLASHLLDGNYRSLSMMRDGYFGVDAGELKSYRDLVEFLNRLNAEWIQATKRLSPHILIQLLKESGKEYRKMIRSLSPFEKALFSVAWAGEKESQNWFHIAREYTEKWHHTQQIFFALDPSDQSLLSEKYYIPYLDTSMRALSSHYQKLDSLPKSLIKVTVAGKFKREWWLQKKEITWSMIPFSKSKPDAHILIPDHLAWRIFTKGISPVMAADLIYVEGNRELGDHFLTMLAVMA